MFSRSGSGGGGIGSVEGAACALHTSSSIRLDATTDDNKNDADRQDIKYVKRRSVKNSPLHVLGLLGLFALVLSAWHYSTYTLHSHHMANIRRTHLRAELLFAQQGRRLEEKFRTERLSLDNKQRRQSILSDWLNQLDLEIRNNVNGGIRWIRPYLLPTLGHDDDQQARDIGGRDSDHPHRDDFLYVDRQGVKMKWEHEREAMGKSSDPIPGPVVDYTDRGKYTYPAMLRDVPPAEQYPPLEPLGDLMSRWNHDDDVSGTIHETLQHFNYSDLEQRAVAQKFRDADVPFKLYDIPEVDAATALWTDEYVNEGFKSAYARGHAQESPNNYFAFFIARKWVVNKLGLPPVRNNDWDFAKFAAHARYADAVRLPPDMPHVYWQSGVTADQRPESGMPLGFISRDLPSFSSKRETFFLFHPEEQKGIQCRFGERGVIAATHYDSGENMIAMINGAKRYILQPPRECSKLGLFTSNHSPIYRHSLLNYAHMRYLGDYSTGMSDEERSWLVRASQAQTIETVLKQGEVLFIPRYETKVVVLLITPWIVCLCIHPSYAHTHGPVCLFGSHWFHYIVSLQKSAQCNVRSVRHIMSAVSTASFIGQLFD